MSGSAEREVERRSKCREDAGECWADLCASNLIPGTTEVGVAMKISEYIIRAAERETRLAVAAAFSRAAQPLDDEINWHVGNNDPHTSCADYGCSDLIDFRDRIRALTPADAAAELERPVAAAVQAEHSNHTQFAIDIYAALVDPVEDHNLKESELFAACLKAATDQRESLYNLARLVAAARLEEAQRYQHDADCEGVVGCWCQTRRIADLERAASPKDTKA